MSKYPEIKLHIGGEWRSRPGQLKIINPSDESELGIVPQATITDLDDALAAADKGFQVWRDVSPSKRTEVILRATALVRQRVEKIALAMTLEQGKPIAQSRLEIIRACDTIEWDAMEGPRLYGRVIPAEAGMRFTVAREPIGVVAAFTPWNFPVSSPARKIGGALASGCSIIIKASEETPAGAFLLVQAFVDAGVPPGVINLVYGDPAEISEYLIPKPSVRLVTFTGSVPVGKRLAELAGHHMKPVIMELGGHAPVIVCEDADPVRSAALSVLGKSRNAGQVCVSPTRFFVHRGVYDTFLDEFAKGAAKLKVGDGVDVSNDMGPLANPRRLAAMEEFVADAIERGARVVVGGKRIGNRGYYFPLTILAGVPSDARVMREEPFGPIALVNPVDSIDDALTRANALPFGLAAYAFTDSTASAELLAKRLECGNLAINHFTASFAETPFGGVKDSGFGREGGTEGLSYYTVTKLVSHRMSA